MLTGLLEDVETADVEERLRPLLRYVDGLGVTASAKYHRLSGERLGSGYAALKDLL